MCVCVMGSWGGGGGRPSVRRKIARTSFNSWLPEGSHGMEINDRKERDLSGLLQGSVSSLVCLDARGTRHPTAKCLVHDVMMFTE